MIYDKETLIQAGGAYISCGYGIDISTACEITRKSLKKGKIKPSDLIPLIENWIATKIENNLKKEAN